MIYCFEDFTLDTERRELSRGHQRLSVEPKVFDLLVHLIAHRNRVVGKDELITAIWNARIVSESALTTCINAARSALGDTGQEQRLIKTLPRKGIRFIGGVSETASEVPAVRQAAPQSSSAAEYALPDKPSVAVLPFTNMSGDPDQEYFADGVVEDIITALSRFRSLFVIARNSSFTYKGRAIDIKQVGRELGVRYVLEGSVRKTTKRVRITAQLVVAATGTHLWADRFDGDVEDIFDLQDRVAASVVGSIAPRLEQAEIDRVKAKRTDNLEAYDYFLRARANLGFMEKENLQKALTQFRRATELDPDFAPAYGMMAWCYSNKRSFAGGTDDIGDAAQGIKVTRMALRLGRDDANVLANAAYGLAYVVRDLVASEEVINRATSLNPNLAMAWGISGWIQIWLGRPENAVEHIGRAMRLSPVDLNIQPMRVSLAHAHYFLDRYDEALSWAEIVLGEAPQSHPPLRIAAASAAFSGRSDDAARYGQRLLAIDPAFRVSRLASYLGPYRDPAAIAKYAEGLRRARLPE